MSGAVPMGNISRALVIGISDYQDAGIADLKYAHRDAEEFANFLKSKSGGNLKDDQLMLFTNEEATTAQVYGALDWLLETCGPDEQAVIYFSGHGDVETKTTRQQGFLLAYDTPKTNYMIGAVRLSDLNGYLESIVQEKKARVIVITDACHSGNLAGGRDGSLATATALSSQFQNQLKIMSCQPNELSQEGEQWGGGRGVFSYYLIDGLTGLADANKDSTVTLMELERYLSNTVPVETDQQQFPFTVGVKTTKLVQVDIQEMLALAAKRGAPTQLAPVAPKGLIEDMIAKADTSIQGLYEEFLAAVEAQYFLPSDLKEGRIPGRSASELFDLLEKEESLRPLRSLMRRNFAVALQDESQRAINAYLNADQAELAKRWNNEVDKYKTNPIYLSKAASLLGEGHVLHNQLKAKQYYFEGLIKRLEGGMAGDTVMLNEALALEFKAIGLDSGAAYVYNEMGLIYDEIRKVYKGMGRNQQNTFYSTLQMEKYALAMNLAPKWVFPVLGYGRTCREIRKLEEGEKYILRAIELDSTLEPAYSDLMDIYYFSKQYKKGVNTTLKRLKLNEVDPIIWYNLSCFAALSGDTELSLSSLEKSLILGFPLDNVIIDNDLSSLQEESAYHDLIKKYAQQKK